MKLTLTFTGQAQPGQVPAFSLEAGGAVIGRGQDSNWVIQDPSGLLSRHHCFVELDGDRYKLTDTSTNGVYINDSPAPIGSDNAIYLKNGDRLGLGAVGHAEITVALEGAGAGAASDATQIRPQQPAPPVAAPPPPPPPAVPRRRRRQSRGPAYHRRRPEIRSPTRWPPRHRRRRRPASPTRSPHRRPAAQAA